MSAHFFIRHPDESQGPARSADKETARIRDEALKRAFQMPHKPRATQKSSKKDEKTAKSTVTNCPFLR
jgi:hypothetical protein